MIYLLLSISSATSLFILFRWFRTTGVHTRHAIMVNYAVASATGFISFAPAPHWYQKPWFLPAAALGVFLYLIFRILGRTTQENGVAVASVANRMSVVIPVMVGLFFLDEQISVLKITGILAGVAAVAFSMSGSARGGGSWHWPLILFLGSGVVDVSLKLFQLLSVSEAEFPVFCSTLFGFAFFSALVHHLFTAERKVRWRSAAGGLILGVCNFGSFYFMLKTLSLPGWESSAIFPINHVGVVALSTVLALVIFREKPGFTGAVSLALAAVAILLLYLSL